MTNSRRREESLLVREHVAHGGQVVEDDRHREGDRGADEVVHAGQLCERHHEAIVDDEGDNAHHAELHELLDELSHRILPEAFHKETPLASGVQRFSSGAPNGNEPVFTLKGPRPNR